MTYQDFLELPIGTIENVRNGNVHYLIVTAVLGTALFCFLGPCSIPLWLICFHFAFCKSCAVIEDLFDPRQPRYWLVGSGYRAELAYSDVNRFRRVHPFITVRP